jgi:hypothetical protein
MSKTTAWVFQRRYADGSSTLLHDQTPGRRHWPGRSACYEIVVRRFGGGIAIESTGERIVFTVSLPIGRPSYVREAQGGDNAYYPGD